MKVDFRHKFESVRMLLFPVQMIFLTTTFSSQMQNRFEIELLLTYLCLIYIHIPIYHLMIAYSVMIIDDMEFQEAAIDFIEQ